MLCTPGFCTRSVLLFHPSTGKKRIDPAGRPAGHEQSPHRDIDLVPFFLRASRVKKHGSLGGKSKKSRFRFQTDTTPKNAPKKLSVKLIYLGQISKKCQFDALLNNSHHPVLDAKNRVLFLLNNSHHPVLRL